MRSKAQSPVLSNHLCKFLSKIWSNGWLDCYSDKHFLIRAMESRIGEFVGEQQLTTNNFDIFKFNQNIADNFLVNFSIKLEYLCKVFGEISIKKYVEDQLSAGKSNYDENQFFRGLTEMEILKYFSTFGYSQKKKAIYEPPIGKNGKNPEARFIYDSNIIIDVEVKTPGFSNKAVEEKLLIPAILLSDTGIAELQSLSSSHGFRLMLPRIYKLVDFLNSAAQKFELPTSENHLNLLYINWSYSEFPSRGYLEAQSLMCNNLNGILKHKEIGMHFGVQEEVYQKISAVIVYTSSLNNIIFQDFRYLWATRNFAIIPIAADTQLLLRVTDMDYNSNMPSPKLLADFKSKSIEEQVEAAYICTKATQIITQACFT